MAWSRNLSTKGSLPERQLWTILEEMELPFLRWKSIDTPFRDYPIEADVLVDDVLVIEVQSIRFHVGYVKKGKWKAATTRRAKDLAKLHCFEALGYGVLWLYDDELRYANQVTRGPIWRPILKQWIRLSLDHAHSLRSLYLHLKSRSLRTPNAPHPTLNTVNLRGDMRRQ